MKRSIGVLVLTNLKQIVQLCFAVTNDVVVDPGVPNRSEDNNSAFHALNLWDQQLGEQHVSQVVRRDVPVVTLEAILVLPSLLHTTHTMGPVHHSCIVNEDVDATSGMCTPRLVAQRNDFGGGGTNRMLLCEF